MTDTIQELATPVAHTPMDAPAPVAAEGTQNPDKLPTAVKSKGKHAPVQPVLEKLFGFYPHLFGEHFLPLKLGIFQELLAAHPEDFNRDTLKAALGVHTRSSRYLQSVAEGQKRHDLTGVAVDEVAPEHQFLSIVELFQRRQSRSTQDLRPKLLAQLVTAYERSGLSRQDYLARIGTPTEVVQAVLDEALAEIEQQRARRTALLNAFDASGKSVEELADSLGMRVADVQAALKERR